MHHFHYVSCVKIKDNLQDIIGSLGLPLGPSLDNLYGVRLQFVKDCSAIFYPFILQHVKQFVVSARATSMKALSRVRQDKDGLVGGLGWGFWRVGEGNRPV